MAETPLLTRQITRIGHDWASKTPGTPAVVLMSPGGSDVAIAAAAKAECNHPSFKFEARSSRTVVAYVDRGTITTNAAVSLPAEAGAR